MFYPNINEDIPPIFDFMTVGNIEANFNNARRQEEMQLGLNPNSINDLEMPSQTEWDKLSSRDRFLFLLNDERKARRGLSDGEFIWSGCAMEGSEMHIQGIAQEHATYLRENNMFTHTRENGNDNFQTIADDPNIGLFSNPLAYGESLAAFSSSEPIDINAHIVDALYVFLYQDKMEGFKHRKMFFLQKIPFSGFRKSMSQPVFIDDLDDMGMEGYLGIGISEGPYNGQPFGLVIVVDHFDPISAGDFLEITDTDALNRDNCKSDMILRGEVYDGIDGLFAVEQKLTSDAIFKTGSTTTFNVGQELILEKGFQVNANASLTAEIENCNEN